MSDYRGFDIQFGGDEAQAAASLAEYRQRQQQRYQQMQQAPTNTIRIMPIPGSLDDRSASRPVMRVNTSSVDDHTALEHRRRTEPITPVRKSVADYYNQEEMSDKMRGKMPEASSSKDYVRLPSSIPQRPLSPSISMSLPSVNQVRNQYNVNTEFAESERKRLERAKRNEQELRNQTHQTHQSSNDRARFEQELVNVGALSMKDQMKEKMDRQHQRHAQEQQRSHNILNEVLNRRALFRPVILQRPSSVYLQDSPSYSDTLYKRLVKVGLDLAPGTYSFDQRVQIEKLLDLFIKKEITGSATVTELETLVKKFMINYISNPTKKITTIKKTVKKTSKKASAKKKTPTKKKTPKKASKKPTKKKTPKKASKKPTKK